MATVLEFRDSPEAVARREGASLCDAVGVESLDKVAVAVATATAAKAELDALTARANALQVRREAIEKLAAMDLSLGAFLAAVAALPVP